MPRTEEESWNVRQQVRQAQISIKREYGLEDQYVLTTV